MVIFKFLKKNNLLYKHCIFISSPGQTKDGHLTGSRDFFSFFYCDNNSQCTIVHYTQSFSRKTNRTCYQLRSIVPYYWVVEILRMNNSIPLSFASIWLYTTCMPPIINHVSDQYSVCFCLHIRGVVVRAYYIGNLRLPSHQVNI